MGLAEVPNGITKINRSEILSFLDTTPAGGSRTWGILGVGITDYALSYNPQVDTEKWVVEDNARNDHTSNQKQGSVTQKCYKGDPVFEFVNAGRDKLNYTTTILDVDTWNGNGTTYPAKTSNVTITVTSYGGENAEIEYDIYYNGDATEGTVTISDGVPTFSPNTSL
jgi:hypothetical protein